MDIWVQGTPILYTELITLMVWRQLHGIYVWIFNLKCMVTVLRVQITRSGSRGNDSELWIEAFTLSSNRNVPGIFKRTSSIELSDLLIAASQNFSSSFQVRFGQFGIVRIVDNSGFQGHNIDDIRIYEAIDDIELKTIDAPINHKLRLNQCSCCKNYH